jgi:hypothetical protein
MYFSPLKEAEALEAGLPIWPASALSSIPDAPMSWVRIAGNILKASGFSLLATRGKIDRGLSAARQAST